MVCCSNSKRIQLKSTPLETSEIQGAEAACTAKIFSVVMAVPLLKQKALYLPSSSPRLPWTWPLIKKYLMHGRGWRKGKVRWPKKSGKSGSKLQASSLANKHFSCQMLCLSRSYYNLVPNTPMTGCMGCVARECCALLSFCFWKA